MNLRPYKNGDINAIKDPKEIGEFTDDDLSVYTNYAETIEDNGIKAVMGIVKLWKGVGQGFVVTSKEYKGGISYVKATKNFISRGMRELGLWRLQTYIDPHWEESERFAEITGLHNECRLQKMSPHGYDLFLYARVEQ